MESEPVWWEMTLRTSVVEPVRREANPKCAVRCIADDAHAEALILVDEREPPGVCEATLARRKARALRTPPVGRDWVRLTGREGSNRNGGCSASKTRLALIQYTKKS